MSLFSIWASFGLTENPYSHATLAADEVGDRLLAGRDQETAVLHMALGSGGSHPTVEGPVGSGKSSLISVSTYRMTQRCLEAKARQLYIATPKFFQVTADLQSFETDVYLALAQTLVRNVKAFSAVGLDEPNVGALGKWLNAP